MLLALCSMPSLPHALCSLPFSLSAISLSSFYAYVPPSFLASKPPIIPAFRFFSSHFVVSVRNEDLTPILFTNVNQKNGWTVSNLTVTDELEALATVK